jgi:hypothetical protein
MLAALARRRRGDEEGGSAIENPLMLAALARRRRGDWGEHFMEHPFLLAALMRRRREDGDGVIDPLMLAAFAR